MGLGACLGLNILKTGIFSISKAQYFVKLHSELADPSELRLDGEEVYFVFPCHNKNPHLASTRKDGPTCLKFVGIPLGVWKLSELCLVGVCRVSAGCLQGV